MDVRPSICRFCHANCGILVELDDGRPIRVTGDRENPAYAGFTCAKGRQLPAQHAHPERLLQSQKRSAAGGYEPIGSDRAMDEVAQKIAALVAEHGPRSVALYLGTYSGPHPASIPFSIGWLLALGSRMLFTSSTLDQPGKSIANALHGRWLAGSYVFDESDVWMLVGNNPLVSIAGGIPPANPSRRLREAKARGMSLVVIDPRRTEVARFADVYLQPRPGEDPALLASLLHVVIREGLVDQAFVRDHVQGFEALEEAVAPFTPAFASGRTGVEASEIERAARVFASGRRGCGVAGTGPNMAPRGNLTEYLLLALNTLCGRWRRAGERVPNPGALLPGAVPKAQAQAPKLGWGFGQKLRVRGFTGTAAGLPTSALADEILMEGEGQVRALICVGSNPMAAWPDQTKTERAMHSLDLLVTLDTKLSETSSLANYVIAPKLSLEVPGLSLSMENLEQTYVGMGYSEPYAQYTPALASPPAGADVIEEWEFFYGLGQRLGLDLRLFPVRPETGVLREAREAIDVDMKRRPSTDEVFEQLVAHSRVPLARVREHPHGAIFDDAPIAVAEADADASERLEVGDATMLGELRDVAAEGACAPEVPGRPFLLVSRRMPNVYNSSGRDIEALTKGKPYNPAYLHPDDLAALGLAPGDFVRIESDRGAIFGVVAAAPELRCGVLSMAHGFGAGPSRDGELLRIGSHTGRLIDTESDYDPYTGIPRMSAVPVSIERLEALPASGA
ncbi:MAG: molybdopterin-dependent oxidoreductase [Deltaproteobacteria bacterium]|nr:molybdopterin-dependent oxidoreductase [Deltaproteobacteria bacterium]MBW2362677.1 molybdopterin-dependent oxidoreductase [Deltaproteobacteria bacterium]